MRKIVESLGNISKDTSTVMRNTLLGEAMDKPLNINICREGLRTIVLVSLIILLRELFVSTIFRMLHPYIAIRMMYTCFAHFCFAAIYVHVHVCTTPHMHMILIEKVKWRRNNSRLLGRYIHYN